MALGVLTAEKGRAPASISGWNTVQDRKAGSPGAAEPRHLPPLPSAGDAAGQPGQGITETQETEQVTTPTTVLVTLGSPGTSCQPHEV